MVSRFISIFILLSNQRWSYSHLLDLIIICAVAVPSYIILVFKIFFKISFLPHIFNRLNLIYGSVAPLIVVSYHQKSKDGTKEIRKRGRTEPRKEGRKDGRRVGREKKKGRKEEREASSLPPLH